MAEQVRLLQCNTCKSVEMLPDYEGDTRGDLLLETLTSRHVFPDGSRHFGNLFKLDKRFWDSESNRKEISAKIREESGHTGFDLSFYEAKATFQEDALTCWAQHNRNPYCNDYKSDKMEIKPDTKTDRKAAGIDKYHAGGTAKRYLCEFCPVHSLVQQAARKKAGLD